MVAKRKISSFSVLLIMATLMTIGVAMIPMLNVKYMPEKELTALTINYNWSGASARILEAEVTSRLESALASMQGIESVSSQSNKGYGSVEVMLKEGTSKEVARFDISSRIRQIYPSLPHGVSYPSISGSLSGRNKQAVLVYTINSAMPSDKIKSFVEDNITRHITQVDGVGDVIVSGATPYVWEVIFSSAQANRLGISSSDIADAINNYFNENNIIGTASDDSGHEHTLKIASQLSDKIEPSRLESLVIKRSDNRVIYLGDVAKVRMVEASPSSYYRINGLNTVTMVIYANKEANTIDLASNVKSVVGECAPIFGSSYAPLLVYDSSEYIKDELDKIYLRTLLSIVILLVFVYIVSRSVRYLFIIAMSMVANILVAFILYNIFELEIHLYSLAGITVSLGMGIDAAIIMVDHYGFYKDRRAFLSIFAALLTTIGSLTIVFFLPQAQKDNLIDFSAVIIINLAVAMVIALLFIPALFDKLPIKKERKARSIGARRRAVKISGIYERFIIFVRRHRALFSAGVILLFGLPVFMLPTHIEDDKGNPKVDFYSKLYNNTFGSNFYNNNIREYADIALGGVLRLFSQHVSESGGYRNPSRPELSIHAAMPEGCTIAQLNEVVKQMENYLSSIEEVDQYQTSISSYNNGSIRVSFKPEYEDTAVPLGIKSSIIAQAINYGGANWRVSGIDDQGFNNNIVSGYKAHSITLTGYNYDTLYAYAEAMRDTLLQNKRVSAPEITGGSNYWYGAISRNEFVIDYDNKQISQLGVNIRSYYYNIYELLYQNTIARVYDGEMVRDVVLYSADRDDFDVWHLENAPLAVDSIQVKLSDFGTITKKRMGNNIYRKDQQYTLTLAYDFVGSAKLANRVTDSTIEKFNNEIFAIGYKAQKRSAMWWSADDKGQYYLLGLIIVIIYLICAVLFESLRKPLVIISLIPISFIGLLMVFYFGDFIFDQGGFASLVLLSGIVVNAGIYLIEEFNIISSQHRVSTLRIYIKAFNRKITPILITIISTAIGLIPFLYDGKDETFWFAFAIGSIGGLLFSIIAIVIFLPMYMPLGEKKRN